MTTFSTVFMEGVYVIDPQIRSDERGFFYRVFDTIEFKETGRDLQFVQMNHSVNLYKGTLRGMHFQHHPYTDAKLVRCTSGKIFDVVIDLRRNSKTFLKWYGLELSKANKRMLLIPEGFAHGFVTLEDDTEVMYYHTQNYHPEAENGVRYDDPAFQIDWPVPVTSLSERDKSFAFFTNNDERIL